MNEAIKFGLVKKMAFKIGDNIYENQMARY